MTIDEIMRPEGRGGSATNYKILEENLDARYGLKIKPTIKVKVFSTKKLDLYVFHIQVPSESNEDHDKKIFYDVIMEFRPNSKEDLEGGSIRDWSIKAFSNCPAFQFTFTRTYKDRDLLPSSVPKSLYNRTALFEQPVMRNPLDLVGIEKTLWLSGKHLIHIGYMNRKVLSGIIEKGDLKSEIKNILSQDDKLVEVQKRAEKVAKAKKAEREKEKRDRTASIAQAKKDNANVLKRSMVSDSLKHESTNKLKTDRLTRSMKR